jgi:hypothetical protein
MQVENSPNAHPHDNLSFQRSSQQVDKGEPRACKEDNQINGGGLMTDADSQTLIRYIGYAVVLGLISFFRHRHAKLKKEKQELTKKIFKSMEIDE